MNVFSSFPLRCEHAYTYHDYGRYHDIELQVGEKVHLFKPNIS